MIDVEARGRHEAALLREEAGRIADTETALQSVLAGEVVVPLEFPDPASPRAALARRPSSRRRWVRIVAAFATVAAFVAVLASRPGDDRREATSPDTAATSADGLVVRPLDPLIECEQERCPSLAVSPEGIMVAYDPDNATLTWFDDEPRVVPISAQLTGTEFDGDPYLVAIGPYDVAYFLASAPNELVAVAPSGAAITRRDWTFGHGGDLRPTASGLVATRCEFIKNECTGGSEWPSPNAELVMPWVDLAGKPTTGTKPYPTARGTNEGIEVRLGDREWLVPGAAWVDRPRPALLARSDGGVVMLLDTFDEDNQPMTLLELSPDGTIDRYFVALGAEDRVRAVLPDGSLITNDKLVGPGESADVVISVWSHPLAGGGNVHLRVYADGRLLRARRYEDSWTEQRLTPEGIQLLRSEITSTGMFDPDQPFPDSEEYPNPNAVPPTLRGIVEIRNGDRFVKVHCCWGSRLDSLNAFERLIARLREPESWLPDNAWDNPEERAYVPSRSAICLEAPDANPQPLEPSPLLTPLPTSAQAPLVSAGHWMEAGDVGGVTSAAVHCFAMATHDARELLEAVEAAGAEPSETGLALDGGSDVGAIHIWSVPYLPDGQLGSTPG